MGLDVSSWGQAAGVPAESAGVPAVVSAAPPPQPVDRELLQQIIEEQQIQTQAPRPQFGDYLGDLSAAFESWLEDKLSSTNWNPLADQIARVAALVLSAGILLVLLVFCVRLLFRAAGKAKAEAAVLAQRPLPESAALDGDEQARILARDLEAQLRAGLIAAALRSLWLWLALRLAPARVDPSWTSRELVQRSGRFEFWPQMQKLDGWIYGEVKPEAQQVRQLWQSLTERLG